MELIIVLTIFSLILAITSIIFSIWNFIELKAQKLSTHTMVPITTPTGGSLEKELEKIIKSAGGDQNDLNRNLLKAGLNVDELV